MKEFDQLSVIYDTEDGKLYDGNQLQPLRYRPSYLEAWRERTIETIGIDGADLEIDIKVLENPTMIGRIVTRVGMLSVTV